MLTSVFQWVFNLEMIRIFWFLHFKYSINKSMLLFLHRKIHNLTVKWTRHFSINYYEEMTKIPVSIKHAGKKLDLDLNTQASGLDFKNDIYAITGVAPER